MENALAIYNQFDQLQRAAMALYKSRYFSDAQDEAKAVVKVMAGAELGLPPFAAMSGIHIIQGKPALGANVIATLIKNDPRYNYKVLELTAKTCRIEFYENGEPCGVSEFTAQDAAAAQTKNMNKFPKNMLFARAISNGAKWYTPGIFGGAPVYTPEELGADVDEDGYIIDITPEPTKATEPVVVTSGTNGRSPELEPEPLLDDTQTLTRKPSSDMMKKLHAAGSAFYGDEWDERRAALVEAVTGGRSSSSKHLTFDECQKLIDGIEKKANAV